MLEEAWLKGMAGEWGEMRSKATFPSRAQVLELAVQLSRSVPGNIVEFGVWKGYSTRVIRDELWRSRLWDPRQRGKRIYACDSFKGLPEGYENLSAGTFATPVPRLTGVRVVEGFFEDSLTPALATEVGRISLAHFDADLESATTCALDWVTPLLTSGSLLLFDEFFGEDPAEYRAFQEWSERTGTRTALLALFGREPSGKGDMTDRRALFQVLGSQQVAKSPPLLLTRTRRKLMSRW
ncbi:TylF/MycF/NovP-related O-methyltransferase [Nonomuraea sp. NPDC050556]|uniref:TylF/MycF/NovP-related O-methyltransferase n=1 Tax=Nonomuraea sp. NPDC050556 TaxID=3364369 RepID=UPI00378EF466